MYHRYRTIVATILSALVLTLGFSTFAFADEEVSEERIDSSSATLEITPVTKRLAMDAGERKTSSITVKNNGDTDLSFYVYAKPYTNAADGDKQDFENENTYSQIHRWITIEDSDGEYVTKAEYTLKPKTSVEVKYLIQTPEDAPAGGQYAAIFVEAKPEGNGQGVIQTISRAGMILYASVNGETIRSAQVNDINASVAAIGSNINVRFTVANEGNIDFQAATEITISSVFGKELYHGNSVSTVLPETTKSVYTEWGDTPSFGIYRLEYNINALNINAKGSRYVLVLSPILFALLIILLIATVCAIVFLVRKHHLNKIPKNIDGIS